MTDTAEVLVRYVRNADESHGTGAIKFHDDDRPDLEIGGVGYVTEEEFHLAAGRGVVLETLTESEARDLGLEPPVSSTERSLSDLNENELKQVAADEGVDLTGRRTNAAKVAAIEEARAAQPEGEGSLPATATTGPPSPGPTTQLAGSGPTTSPSTTGTSGTA